MRKVLSIYIFYEMPKREEDPTRIQFGSFLSNYVIFHHLWLRYILFPMPFWSVRKYGIIGLSVMFNRIYEILENSE